MYQSHKPMDMQLKLLSITVHNFKSYRGTHIIGKLNPKLTAIIGPNGSGKSNVIDCMLFVFGFRANKMRHSSSVNLIYSGDKREDMCYVELEFNKFRIRREVYSSKKSKYFVDGDESSATAVSLLLSNENVDMEHNRFLILQGEIENIATMKPIGDGLLERLEDVIGTSKYKSLIEEKNVDIKRFEEDRDTKMTTLKFYQNEYQYIEQKRNESLKIVEKKVLFLRLKKSFYKVSNEMHRRALLAAEESWKNTERELSVLLNENKENSCRLEDLEKECERSVRDLKDVENLFLNAKREHQRITRERKLLEEEKMRLFEKIKELGDEIEEMKLKKDVKMAEFDGFRREIEHNDIKIKKYEEEATEIAEKLHLEKENINKLAWKNVESIKFCEMRVAELLERKSTAEREFGSKEAEFALLVNKRDELALDIKEVEKKLADIDRVCINSDMSEDAIEHEIKSIEGDLFLTQKEIAKRVQIAEECVENDAIARRETEIFEKIGSMCGVHGKLADLGNIESRYETALMAAGKSLSWIVVDTTETAEKCVSIIRKHNLSRAVFIILDRIGEISDLPKETVPYLYRLVKCEKKFRKCFYFALKDTLVCEDMKTAERIAFGAPRHRVVTLDGRLIEKSGVMSKSKASGKIRKVEDLEKACMRMVNIRNEMMEKLRLIRNSKEREGLERLRKKFLEEIEDTIGKVEESEWNLNRRDVEEFDSEINKIKAEICCLQGELDALFSAEATNMKERLCFLNNKIEIFEKRNLELKMCLNSTEGLSIGRKEAEMKEKEDNLRKISIPDASGFKEDAVKWEYEYKERLNSLMKIQEEHTKIKKNLCNNYHLEIDLKGKLDDFKDFIRENKKKLGNFDRNIAKLYDEESIYRGIYSCNENDVDDSMDIENMKDKDIAELIVDKTERVKLLEKEIYSAGGTVDLCVFQEYEDAKCEYLKSSEEVGLLVSKLNEILEEAENFKKRRFDEFMDGFSQISGNLKDIYRRITCGGNAELELVDYLDPFGEGIVLSVMPPGKSWKNIGNLSGGEKTLSSLALIFALHKYKPSPFYVMDEIDAALDYRNVCVVSNYVKEMSETAQFLVVSLRSDMFELSNSLLCVYKVENVSMSFVLNIDDLKFCESLQMCAH